MHRSNRIVHRSRVALATTAIAIAAIALSACGSDGSSTSATAGPDGAGATTSATDTTPSIVTAPSMGDSTPPSAGSPDTAMPGTTMPAPAPSSTTAAAGVAASALLTAADLAGWTAQPADSSDGAGGGLPLDQPACATVAALDADPALQDNASVSLLSPDRGTQIAESVTIGDAAAVQRAFDALADHGFATCLEAALTAALQRPGLLPAGAALGPIDVAAVASSFGEQSIAYGGTVTVTGGPTTETIGVRIDAIRHGNGLALLFGITAPLAAPIDPAPVATAAATKLTSATSAP